MFAKILNHMGLNFNFKTDEKDVVDAVIDKQTEMRKTPSGLKIKPNYPNVLIKIIREYLSLKKKKQ